LIQLSIGNINRYFDISGILKILCLSFFFNPHCTCSHLGFLVHSPRLEQTFFAGKFFNAHCISSLNEIWAPGHEDASPFQDARRGSKRDGAMCRGRREEVSAVCMNIHALFMHICVSSEAACFLTSLILCDSHFSAHCSYSAGSSSSSCGSSSSFTFSTCNTTYAQYFRLCFSVCFSSLFTIAHELAQKVGESAGKAMNALCEKFSVYAHISFEREFVCLPI